MRRLVWKPESRRFALDGILLVNAGAITGFLYLLVHPILGRTLSGLQYYSVVQLLGLLAVLSVPSSAANVAISRYVAEFAQGNQVALWVTIVRRALRRIACWGAAALAGWCLAAAPLAGLLKAPSAMAVVLLGTMAYVSLFAPIVQGTLQGSQRFGWLAAAMLLAALLRVALAGAVTPFVPTVEAAMVAVAASMLAGLLIGAWPLRRIVTDTAPKADYDTRPIYRFFWPVLLGQGAVFVLSTADVILAARLLETTHLSAYGKVATLSRTVLFLAQPIAVAMFPRAVTSARLRVLLAPLAVAFLISAAGATALTILPSLPMRLMYGVRDPSYDPLTRLYVWAVLPHAMTMFVSQYLWARHRTGSVLWLLPIAALYLAGLGLWHGTPTAMITVLAVAGWVSLAVLMMEVVRVARLATA